MKIKSFSILHRVQSAFLKFDLNLSEEMMP